MRLVGRTDRWLERRRTVDAETRNLITQVSVLYVTQVDHYLYFRILVRPTQSPDAEASVGLPRRLMVDMVEVVVKVGALGRSCLRRLVVKYLFEPVCGVPVEWPSFSPSVGHLLWSVQLAAPIVS